MMWTNDAVRAPMKIQPTDLHVTQLVPTKEMGDTFTLSPKLRRARVAVLQAQAHFDALSKDPAAVAWAAVMDALWVLVSSPGEFP